MPHCTKLSLSKVNCIVDPISACLLKTSYYTENLYKIYEVSEKIFYAVSFVFVFLYCTLLRKRKKIISETVLMMFKDFES